MLYFVYMMEGRNSQDQITSDRSKRAWSGYVLFILKVGFYWRRSRSRSLKRSRKRAYDWVKIKNRSRKQNHKRDGIVVGRIRTFPLSSDSAYDSVAYDPVKTRLSESEAEAEGWTNPAMHFPTLCDWFSSSTFTCDSDNLLSTWS